MREEIPASIASLGVTTVFSAIPKHFQGVGQWYEEFDQTSDEEVLSLLSAVNAG